MPRTSPTFQSRLGLSGCVLWQLTQTGPMLTGVAIRTCRSKIEPETSTTGSLGLSRRVAMAFCSKPSRAWGSRPLKGRSEMKRYFTVPSCALMSLPNSMDSLAGMGMAPELPTVVRGRHRPVGLQHTPDDLTTVEGPHLIDDPT